MGNWLTLELKGDVGQYDHSIFMNEKMGLRQINCLIHKIS